MTQMTSISSSHYLHCTTFRRTRFCLHTCFSLQTVSVVVFEFTISPERCGQPRRWPCSAYALLQASCRASIFTRPQPQSLAPTSRQEGWSWSGQIHPTKVMLIYYPNPTRSAADLCRSGLRRVQTSGDSSHNLSASCGKIRHSKTYLVQVCIRAIIIDLLNVVSGSGLILFWRNVFGSHDC